MRTNEASIAWASVLTVRVFARPGTPSMRMWPRQSMAMSRRSTRTSWPTMIFATSPFTASMNLHVARIRRAGDDLVAASHAAADDRLRTPRARRTRLRQAAGRERRRVYDERQALLAGGATHL